MNLKSEIIMNPIYVITTFNIKEGEINRQRTVGYYNNFDYAAKVVESNSLNINEEGYYSHAVIEELNQGLYPSRFNTDKWFYEWNCDVYVRQRDFDDPQPNVNYAPIG